MSDAVGDPGGSDQAGLKHDAWVVPYADMLTLLFAMFVVLYAIGRSENKELLMQQFARGFVGLPVSGPSKGRGEERFGKGFDGDGGVVGRLDLVTSQSEGLKRFIQSRLPETFEEIAGKSLVIDLTNDTWSFSVDLESFFEPGRPQLRPRVRRWLLRFFSGELGEDFVWEHAAYLRIEIAAPEMALPTRDPNGVARGNNILCHQRLTEIEDFLVRQPEVHLDDMVTQFRRMADAAQPWEVAGRITFAFSNR